MIEKVWEMSDNWKKCTLHISITQVINCYLRQTQAANPDICFWFLQMKFLSALSVKMYKLYSVIQELNQTDVFVLRFSPWSLLHLLLPVRSASSISH